jgi:hypothetical protein
MLSSQSKLIYYATFPCHEVTLLYMLTRIADQPEVESKVMDAGYLHGKQLSRLEEMMEVGFGGNTVYLASIRVKR